MHLCISLFSNFGGARFQSHSLTQQKISTNITSYLKHGCQKFTQKHPLRMPLHALIVRDLHSLRYAVPSFPAFASSPYSISAISPAHVSGVGCTISRTPYLGFSPNSDKTGFTVSLLFPFPCHPILALDWVEACISADSAHRSAASGITRTALHRCQTARILAFSISVLSKNWRFFDLAFTS